MTNKLNQTQEGKFFKGTIGSFFSEDSAFSKKYVYGFYAEMFQYKRLKVYKGDTENFKDHLSSEFLSGIHAMTPEMLVKKYGTHVLTSIILGAKLNALYQAETSDQNRLLAQHAGYDAAMKSTFGMLLSGRLDPLDSAKLRTITAPKIAFEAVGGQPGQIKIITAKKGKGKVVDTNDWRQSINPENAVFIGTRELIPISALIENAGKKKEVEDYLSRYLKANEVKLRD